MENYVNDEQKNWFDKWGWKIAIGVLAVALIWLYFGGGKEWMEGEDAVVDPQEIKILKGMSPDEVEKLKEQGVKYGEMMAELEEEKMADTTRIKNQMRKEQLKILKQIEIAKAERVMNAMRHQAIVERDQQDMERHKVRTLYEVKDVMYQGLIKKLKEMADDETLSFDMLYNKYKEKLQLFEKDLLNVDITSLSAADDSIGAIIIQADGSVNLNKGQKTVEE